MKTVPSLDSVPFYRRMHKGRYRFLASASGDPQIDIEFDREQQARLEGWLKTVDRSILLEPSERLSVEAAVAFRCCFGASVDDLSDLIGLQKIIETFRKINADKLKYRSDADDIILAGSWPPFTTENRIGYLNDGDSVTVYRGGAGPVSELIKGVCWTTSLSSASHYRDLDNGILISYVCSNKELIGLISDEWEVILDPAFVAFECVKLVTE